MFQKIKKMSKETRSEVMMFALEIENGINKLIMNLFLIFEPEKTKNFGNKAGIPFQSKIDLLFDIGILTKEEHAPFELLMNFRNKFLHDINSDSFMIVFKNFDNGIQNRFKKYIIEPNQTITEDNLKMAFKNLYKSNLVVLTNKFSNRRDDLDSKIEFLNNYRKSYGYTAKLFAKFNKQILELIIETEENQLPKDEALIKIGELGIKYMEEFSDSDAQKFINSVEDLPESFYKKLIN